MFNNISNQLITNTSSNLRSSMSYSKHLSPSASPPLSMQKPNNPTMNNFFQTPPTANNNIYSEYDEYNKPMNNQFGVNNKPTPLIDASQTATKKGPEKLFSARNVNNRLNAVPQANFMAGSNRNLSSDNSSTTSNIRSQRSEPPPTNRIQPSSNTNTCLEFDEEGSINSQFSCVSKLSSNSVQSEFLKGLTQMYLIIY